MSYPISNRIESSGKLYSYYLNFFRILTILIFTSTYYFNNTAQAGVFEISSSFSFNQSHFGKSSYQWTRRWGASFGYYFFARSELEIAVQDVLYRNRIYSIEDTTYHDKIYSLNWVQSLLPRRYALQPYFKVGIGQLNRDASGSYLGTVVPTIYDALTGILGVGIRINLIRELALKAEATTYLTGGSIATWQDNFALNGGFSFFF